MECIWNHSLIRVVRDVMKTRAKNGYVVKLFGKPIKFGEADIDEFEKIFKTLKANNGQH